MIDLADLRIAARLLQALPGFLRHPLRPEEAQVILARRRARREADFVALVHRAVSGRPDSPYRALLAAAGGMTLLDTDVVRVLEETLPARFGGGPTDYQLVEDEGPAGTPRLRLLVHPAVGKLDSATVAATFLEALATGPGAARVMGLAWADAGFLQVERTEPRPTASGKILHLHTRLASRT